MRKAGNSCDKIIRRPFIMPALQFGRTRTFTTTHRWNSVLPTWRRCNYCRQNDVTVSPYKGVCSSCKEVQFRYVSSYYVGSKDRWILRKRACARVEVMHLRRVVSLKAPMWWDSRRHVVARRIKLRLLTVIKEKRRRRTTAGDGKSIASKVHTLQIVDANVASESVCWTGVHPGAAAYQRWSWES